MGEIKGKRRRKLAPKWQYVGLGVLAIATVGAVGSVLMTPETQPPIPASVTTYAPPIETKAPPKKVAVIGDSYSQGTGASSKSLGWVSQLSRHQGWNITNLARGGTGYATSVNTPATANRACGLDRCPNYAGMIPDVAAASPEIILVAGGRNDSKVATESEATAISEFYTQLRAAAPNAKIIAFNPLWDSTPAPESLGAIAAVVSESVTSIGGVYLDAGQPLAGHPDLIAADGVHPKDIGHAAILQAKITKLQQAGIAAP